MEEYIVSEKYKDYVEKKGLSFFLGDGASTAAKKIQTKQ